MKELLAFLFVGMAAASCSHQSRQIGESGKCIEAGVATATAIEVVRTKGRTEEYVLEQAKPRDAERFWNIWIPRREFGFQGQCLIRVQKSDCRAEWVPLK
jgi:hypothetical protein